VYHGNPANLDILKGRRIAVGVCAGIASYKVCGAVSTLAQAGVQLFIKERADFLLEGEILGGKIHIHQAISLMAQRMPRRSVS
jgi:hypothetical protein